MLYQTSHPISSISTPFSPSFTPNPLITSSLPPLFPHPLLTVQANKEMDCVEAALKASFRKEMAWKSSQQAIFEDLWALNVQNGAPCDDFSVDDLLNFSNEDCEEPEEEHKAGFVSVSLQEEDQTPDSLNPSSSVSQKDDFPSLPATELNVLAEDLANLEWLSHFVEDSFSEPSVAYPAGFLKEKPENQTEKHEVFVQENSVQDMPCFKSPVPAKARTKRTRSGGRVWSLGSPSLTESSSSSTSSCSSSSPASPWLVFTSTTQSLEQVCSEEKGPVFKKPKKKPVAEPAGNGGGQPCRRCSHCGVQKTPQWRTGPMGAKTLCNACGVRYKSGRLLPEYRPACSPTFSSEFHSNHHRRVLEMRRKKELMAGVESQSAAPEVPSF